MLRPATPLSVLLFAAFALLLISVLSTPIIRGIPLASEGGVDFGVFGFCSGSQCSTIEIGYSTDKLSATENASFDLPTATRKTLSTILIVHPVAALFTLIMLILALSAHFHSPSHSPRYLLGMFILSIFTLLLSILCFLVDVLLFVPHMSWGSYIVLAATVLIFISGIVSCAMRRTLVSRKARKKRIAENAEMNGENFFNRAGGATLPPVSATPMASGALGSEPKVATFELQKSTTDQSRTSDERMPLTARSLSNKSPNDPNLGMSGPGSVSGMDERYGDVNGGRQFNGPRDQFGNPLPPQGSFGGQRSRDPSQESRMRNQYPGGPVPVMRGRGGPVMRGRGGYGPPPRGGYGPPPGRGGYGPPPGRGGFGPPPGRGAYGPGPNYRGGMIGPVAGGMAAGMMGRGRGPPPGYSNGYNGPPPQGYPRNPSPPRGGYGMGAIPYERRPSDPNAPAYGYGRNPSPGPPNAQGYVAYPGNSDLMDLPRAESPPPLPGMNNTPPPAPIGQAIEMDASTGSPSHTPVGFGGYGGALRDSDGDVAGMVGLQQSGLPAHLTQGKDRVMSDTSFYSSDEPYVPPRQAWGDAGPPGSRNPSPLNSTQIVSQPVELEASPPTPNSPSHNRQNSSDNYYEDVDPRFAEPEAQPRSQSAANSHSGSNADSHSGSHAESQRAGSRTGVSPPALQLPNTQVPGVAAYNPNSAPSNTMGGLHPMPSYDGAEYEDEIQGEIHNIPPGARSPAESEGAQSNFTSISQRGVNPRWQGDRGGGGFIPRRPLPPRNDQAVLLNSNPDFELPGAGPTGRGFNGRGGNNGRGAGMPLPRGGLIGGGPYPGA